ncbi:caspase-14-like [Epinephelus moara]|uniref:caspase-14-like n=1 Tax=Epinephelus moara TaxID=300413 RepID=UPI00214EB0DB|nr:caspase-14-like [Epinephelus moara]
MAYYSNQISTNARVARWGWSEYDERHYSQGDWNIQQQNYAAVYGEAVDTEDYVALSQASCRHTSTTYENSTDRFIEEAMALSLKALVIDKHQPHNMIAYEPALEYTLDGKRMALIVCDTSRDGCQHDIQRVLKFCGQNGFSCYQTAQFTKAGLMDDLEAFKGMLSDDVCCLTIFIMAHGSLGHINVSNGQIELQRIFEMFDNRGCPALRGNPKLFVIQACRGVQQCSNNPCFDASELSGVDQERLWPVESDSLFVYAVCPGNLAIRYPDTGSPLFEEMNHVFSQSGSDYSMHDLFTMVNSRLEKRIERVGYKTDRRPWQIPQNLVMPGLGRRREASGPVGGPLHIVDRLTQKWYLR